MNQEYDYHANRGALFLASAALAVFFVVGALVLALRISGDIGGDETSDKATSVQKQSSTVSAASGATTSGKSGASTTMRATTITTTTSPESDEPKVHIPVGAVQIPGAAGDYGKVYTFGPTSVEFGIAVREAYVAESPMGRQVTITAFSPTTNRTYQMTCRGAAVVECSGANDAHVYLVK